ncbi:protein IQ-DOMAIN 1 [Senna tora]|uniref:Protein IQ-DOMAIN 1 n=1 Tax=Senna tora TaxID=362788 RepID=A0A834WAF0_9FABA|nr:protein IQ-DOMAIN 1 [Senna tora]
MAKKGEDAAFDAVQAAVEVTHLTCVPSCYLEKTKEEIATIKIQTAFRGYLAKRALQTLRGLMRLEALIKGHYVKQQVATTLKCMQALARRQSQVRVRRIRMSEENQTLCRLLQQKHERELNKPQDNITCKNPSKLVNTKSVVNNTQWGWSWLDRWMASRPWEPQRTIIHHNATSHAMPSEEGQLSARDFNKVEHSPLAPISKASSLSSIGGKARPPPPSLKGNVADNHNTRSVFSTQPGRYRRHSIAGSSVTNDENLKSSPAFSSNMTQIKSGNKAKSRRQSPSSSSLTGKGSVISTKRPPFSSNPAGSKRHSCPPEVEIFSEKDTPKKKYK